MSYHPHTRTVLLQYPSLLYYNVLIISDNIRKDLSIEYTLSFISYPCCENRIQQDAFEEPAILQKAEGLSATSLAERMPRPFTSFTTTITNFIGEHCREEFVREV